MKVTKVLLLCIAGIAALVGAATAIVIFRGEITDFIMSMKGKYFGDGGCCSGDDSSDFAD